MEDQVFHNVEGIISHLNGYGRFQKALTFICACFHLSSAFYPMITFFVTANPDWTCIINSTSCHLVGVQPSTNPYRCIPNVSRTDWKYTVETDYSIVTEYDLICSRQWLEYLSTSVLSFGWFFGAISIGEFCNRFGRKPIIFTSLFFVNTLGLVISFSPNIYFFIACEFLIGVFIPGSNNILYLYLGEMVDNKNRPFAHMIIATSYTLALCIVSVNAYFIRKWRYLRIACSAPYLIFFIYYKFVPESVHWLHLRGYHEQMKNVFGKIAKMNKISLPGDLTIKNREGTSKQQSSAPNIFTVVLFSDFRKRIWLLMYLFFSANSVYYSFFMTADQFNVSMYMSFILFSVIEIPSNMLGSFCSSRLGRKKSIPGSLLIGCLGSFIVAGLQSTNQKILRIIIGMLVQGSLIVSFNYLISWTTEILPTDIRAVALGLVVSIGRLGGITAPWMGKALVFIHPLAPFFAIGIMGLISTGLMMFLPETKGVPIADTSIQIDDTNVNAR